MSTKICALNCDKSQENCLKKIHCERGKNGKKIILKIYESTLKVNANLIHKYFYVLMFSEAFYTDAE